MAGSPGDGKVAGSDPNDAKLSALALAYVDCRRGGRPFAGETSLYEALCQKALQVTRRYRSAAAAEELAHEVATELMTGGALLRHDPTVGGIPAYVLGVAKNVARDDSLKARFINKDPRRSRRAAEEQAGHLWAERRERREDAPPDLVSLLAAARARPSLAGSPGSGFADTAAFRDWWSHLVGGGRLHLAQGRLTQMQWVAHLLIYGMYLPAQLALPRAPIDAITDPACRYLQPQLAVLADAEHPSTRQAHRRVMVGAVRTLLAPAASWREAQRLAALPGSLPEARARLESLAADGRALSVAFPAREERIVLFASCGLTLSQRHAARVLGVRQQTVQEHLAAGRRRLRRLLDRERAVWRRAVIRAALDHAELLRQIPAADGALLADSHIRRQPDSVLAAGLGCSRQTLGTRRRRAEADLLRLVLPPGRVTGMHGFSRDRKSGSRT